MSNKFAAFGGGGQKCPECGKTCYAKEGVPLGAALVHRACFRCAQCGAPLRANAFVLLDGQRYCEPHGQQLLAADEPAADAGAAPSDAVAAPEIVNKTGGVEIGGKTLFGVDAETALRRMANYDLQWESETRAWIAAVLRVADLDGETLHDALKDGQVLCRFVNAIKPGAVKKINTRSLALMEMENIKLFLQACWKLGVPSGSLFNTNDLYKNADMTAVLQTMQALGRIAQTIDTFEGPHYGQKVATVRKGKHYHVDTNHLVKKFVQSSESADSQAMRARLLKLEQELARERFAKEQLLGGNADAAAVLGASDALRGELDDAKQKSEALEKQVERLQASLAEVSAELEWERSKDSHVVTAKTATVGDGEAESLEDLKDELNAAQAAMKMLRDKRKSDLAKLREARAAHELANKTVDELALRVARLERDLREANERAESATARADLLEGQLAELAASAAPAPAGVVETMEVEDDEAARAAARERDTELRDMLLALLSAPDEWSDDLVTDDDVMQLQREFATEDGRRAFVRQLDEVLEQVERRCIAPTAFKLLGQILSSLLSAMSASEDVDLIAAGLVMDAVTALHIVQDDGEAQYLQQQTRGHAVWSNITFWSEKFFTNLLARHAERSEAAAEPKSAAFEAVSLRGTSARRGSGRPGADSASPGGAADNDDDDVFDLDPEVLVNLLGVYVSKLESWGCSTETIEEFVRLVCNETSLPPSYAESINNKLRVKKTVAEMQKTRLARKERRRTRAESLLQPVKGRARSDASTTTTPKPQ